MTTCDVFWGSHGCDHPLGHKGLHWCSCCDLSDPVHVALHASASIDQYGVDGCVGYWPYYGSKAMTGLDATLPFFRYPPGANYESLPDELTRLARCL